MKKAASNSNEIKPDLDKAKKVYRAAVEAIRRLSESLKQKKAYRDVFLQEAVGLRNKLKEYCERLMFYNPIEYGRMAEEVLWRKVFYDIIQLVKKNRKHIRSGSSLEAAYRTHLSSASGYYYHLLFRLQYEFGLKLDNQLDFPLIPDHKAGRNWRSSSKKRDVTPNVQEWALKACHRCLVCLGDIARYQQDFDGGYSTSTAERFYQQAIALFPEIGMPHNQLGTLAGSWYFHCEAAYHYMRCMVCDKSFDGAEANLQRLFEKNQRRLQDFKQTPNVSDPEEKCYYDLKFFFVHFLNLLKIFFDISKAYDSAEIQECCQTTLQSFNLCMFYEPVIYNENNEEENYMDDDIVYKIVVICMATIHLLQKRGSRQVTAATAFLLALFSHILNHAVLRLQGALYEKENPNKLLQNAGRCEPADDDTESDTCERRPDRLTQNGDLHSPKQIKEEYKNKENEASQQKKTRPNRLRRLRRRRQRVSSDDSEETSDISDVSDLSEGSNDDDDDHNNFISDESDDDLVSYFNSESEISDVDSQDLDHESKTEPLKHHLPSVKQDQSLFKSPLFPNSSDIAGSHVWNNIRDSDSLAHFSSELFSSSVSFLGHNFKLSPQTSNQYEKDVEEFENCKDVIQGRKEVSVPPGFATTMEAKHVAEITHKLANFVIETDTEASIIPTDAEQSMFTETEVDDLSGDSSSTKDDSGSDEADQDLLHLQNVIEVMQSEGLLPVVKIMCDWMNCNSGVIMTCAQSSQSVWCRLSVLLNILPSETLLAKHDQCWLEELKMVMLNVSSVEWKQVIPLREDISLLQFSPLAEAHSSIDFNIKMSGRLTDMQESFLRSCCLRHFGFILSTLEGLHFLYQEDKNMFIGPTQPTNQEENEQDAMERMADEESRRNQLMRDMAQLRLQAEVSQLEGSLQTSDQAVFPPYLIPDTSTLCTTLPLIRQLTQINRSIIVIPLAVIDTLDFQKKESMGAREAIRWLESEFRKGNRCIRAQKSSEKLQGGVPRNMKKKNRETWCILEILNCAQYLAQQGGDLGSESMVTILSTSDYSTEQHQLVQQGLNNSKQDGVVVENISTFINKWKSLLKSKG
ncbi:hypothetical protein CHS0354_004412 [Potamilus streckersoni]|uniref:PIN domain-containing protein n=1 Tax=Potamilus streckersoni TaxID=2493646 RepID=A0AAE0SZV9_9BIVA|nr:hypothetical protein CHS0354_004412 [Potamilus streckersoni]